MNPSRPHPSPADLHQVLSQVLEAFAYALPVPRAGEARLDYSVRGDLPQQMGWLVLRSTPALAARLAGDAVGDEAEDLGRDAFAELCNLSVSHLVSRLWGDQHGAFKPFVPAEGLPHGVLRSRVLLDVDGEPLEASHWSLA